MDFLIAFCAGIATSSLRGIPTSSLRGIPMSSLRVIPMSSLRGNPTSGVSFLLVPGESLGLRVRD